jgi:ribosomal protein L30E
LEWGGEGGGIIIIPMPKALSFAESCRQKVEQTIQYSAKLTKICYYFIDTIWF